VNTNRCLYARFEGRAILEEQGRIMFALLQPFSRSGYQIRLHHRNTVPLGKYGELACGLPGLTLVDQRPDDAATWVLLGDDEGIRVESGAWRYRWRVAFDLFSPYWFSEPVIVPYPMHPLQTSVDEHRLDALRRTDRRLKVFFSGDSKGYERMWIRYPKPKLPRLEVLRALLDAPSDDVVLLKDAAALRAPGSERFDGKCVIGDPQGCWIDAAEWLPTLAMADFFLAPPGIVMPMCHNIVEAMAVGTIPITSYPEWFSPPLQHLENCLVFNDQDDLRAKIRMAMSLPPAEVERLRANVLDHFQCEMRPDVVVRRIEARAEGELTLLMHTEGNTKANVKRLGRWSTLFAGGRRSPWARWMHPPGRA
jgi:hypothetical protein